jgi:hypothetical protein
VRNERLDLGFETKMKERCDLTRLAGYTMLGGYEGEAFANVLECQRASNLREVKRKMRPGHI